MTQMANVVFRRGIPGIEPDAFIVGADASTSTPPVVVVHGIQRQVENMAQLMKSRAAEIERTIILPHFDLRHWKRYQQAACASRSDIALLSLMNALLREGRVAKGRYDLSGFSGGAQFAHRFAWMHPNAVNRVCLTAPGWLTFPDARVAWPYGTGATQARRGVAGYWLQANLHRFLDREIVVRVGAEDTMRDANLRAGPAIDAQQGRTRVDRAHNWVRAMRHAADKVGLRHRISFEILEGCGHSFEACVLQARLDQMFAVPTNTSAGCHPSTRCKTIRNTDFLERSAA